MEIFDGTFEIKVGGDGIKSTNDEDTSSTNILKFIENFESDNDEWIDTINNKF